MPFAPVGNDQIYYEEHGKGQPLLLVTGLGGNASFWNALIPKFARRFRVVVHDARGSGKSTMSRITYSAEQMAADIIALMDALGIARAHFVGHSLGGCIGQVMGIDHAERLDRLVISSSWARPDAYYRRIFEVRRRILESSGVEAYFRAGALFLYPGEWIARNIAQIEATEAAMIANAPPVEILLSKIEAVVGFDRYSELDRIRAPTLVNCAIDDILDPVYYSKEIAGRIPNAQLKTLTGGAHFCPVTMPDAYFRQVSAFLAVSSR